MSRSKSKRPVGIEFDPVMKAAYQAMRKVARARHVKYDQPTFYSPQEWRERGEEELPMGTLLVVTHDGGDLAPYLNASYAQPDLYNGIRSSLKKLGYRLSQESSWYTAVLPLTVNVPANQGA
jgi:hypothetical protein